MILIINEGKVFAFHTDEQLSKLGDLYPVGFAIYQCPDMAIMPGDPDPRTPEQIAAFYRDQRRLVYPSLSDQLDMIYHDQVNGTTVWRDTIAAVKSQFPKPTT